MNDQTMNKKDLNIKIYYPVVVVVIFYTSIFILSKNLCIEMKT